MRWTRWMSFGTCLVSIGTTAVLWSCSPAGKSTTAAGTAAADPVARGRYLVGVLGCNDCHTPGSLYGAPDTTRKLSGSELGWKGPWGVSYPQNITPDSTTGIGTWTQEQIVATIRGGKRPDGTPLLPPMPWPDFAGLTDDDANAVAAYLKSIPPVNHKNLADVPPTAPFHGAAMVFPPPPAWDAPKGPPPGGAAPDTTRHS